MPWSVWVTHTSTVTERVVVTAALVIVAARRSAGGSSVVHSGEEAYQAFSDDAKEKYIASRSDPSIGSAGYA